MTHLQFFCTLLAFYLWLLFDYFYYFIWLHFLIWQLKNKTCDRCFLQAVSVSPGVRFEHFNIESFFIACKQTLQLDFIRINWNKDGVAVVFFFLLIAVSVDDDSLLCFSSELSWKCMRRSVCHFNCNHQVIPSSSTKWPEQIFHLFSAAANRGVISIGLKLVTAAVIFYYNNIYIYLFIVVIFTIYIKKLTIIITYNALCLFSVINPVDELNDCTKTQ